MTQAQPPLEFIPPAFSPWLLTVGRLLMPTWIRSNAKIVDLQVRNAETLAELYEQFQAGKIRFMMAFRHPSTNDPLCMGQLVWHHVPHAAQKRGIKLKATHAHFIYDRGIPLWAGKQVGWLYSHLGGTPIRRGKVDLMGLRSVRQLFASGQFPIAAAPEGATNGHNELVSPIEPGIAQFGFWCLEDLQKEKRSEQVFVVPIGIQYKFVGAPWKAIDHLLHSLEVESGLDAEAEPFKTSLQDNTALTKEQETILYKRLYRLGEHLLGLMEQFYSKFYGQTIASLPSKGSGEVPESDGSSSPANEQLATRLHNLLNAALSVAEDFFDLQPKGTVTDRCRRLEQAGWDRIYREDFKQIEALSPVERGLADRVAEEASLRLWHMRVVESFVSVTGRYVIEKPTVDRFAETLLLLWETITRIKGKTPFPRPQLGKQRVQITVGEPISVSDRWDSYQVNRRQAVSSLTQDLQTSLESMVE